MKYMMRRNQKPLLLLIMSICLLGPIGYVFANPSSQSDLATIQKHAYTFLRYVEEGRLDAAEASLSHVENIAEVTELATQAGPYSLDQLIREARFTLMDKSASEEEVFHRAITVVLYVDALDKDEEQLWEVWKEELEHYIGSATASKSGVTNESLRYVYQLYERILPAMFISLDRDVANEVVAQQHSILNAIAETPSEERSLLLGTYQERLASIEAEEGQLFTDAADFLWIIWTIGGVIFLTLLYVGWRKYKGEKQIAAKTREHDS